MLGVRRSSALVEAQTDKPAGLGSTEEKDGACPSELVAAVLESQSVSRKLSSPYFRTSRKS